MGRIGAPGEKWQQSWISSVVVVYTRFEGHLFGSSRIPLVAFNCPQRQHTMSRPIPSSSRDSPGPRIHMSRPAWPWSPHGHSASSSSSFNASTTGTPSPGSGFVTPHTWAATQQGPSVSSSNATANSVEAAATRHWTFTVIAQYLSTT